MAFPPQLGVVCGDKNQQLSQDSTSENHFIEIDRIHRQIHRGINFSADNLSAGINTATPKRYLLITPNTSTRIHFVFEVETGGLGGGAKVELFEGPTTTANGTAITPINNNRNSATVATLQVFQDPTVTADGTSISIEQSGTTTGGGRVSGHITHNDEFILKQNTKYQLKVTVLANNTDVNARLEWYETT